ncbi:ACP S-malonyltransferase [Curtobacterium flaccumfaciens pv. flaccumfaciens]|uniref:ACP S-malonyltransferase n=1 Tax=Curtobacterium flaccumfaciens TaxID=2035 RepID=UPI00217D0512|nr:ACP S-malonyltransferase [Curtobacterium flaccumfaciens]MCS6552325.1 ACP S-malonyltransferase [Curtobacterium flaccumfaciens pv. flaccumfaciens]
MTKAAFLCSGQGSQYVGMGRELVRDSTAAAAAFDEASEAIGIDLRALCFESTAAELARTVNTQPAILTLSVAQARASAEREALDPAVIAGHSLGEITALTLAGSIGFADAVRLARRRGELMQQAVPEGHGLMQQAVPEGHGLMLAVMTREHEAVIDLCAQVSEQMFDVVQVSNLNSNTQVVVAGSASAVLAVHGRLEDDGIRSTPLNVSVPFHSPLMEPVVAPLREQLASIEITAPQVTVLSNATGRPYRDEDEIVELLLRQVVEPVRWVENQRWMRMHGIDYAVEFGPGQTLSGLMRHTHREVPVFSYDSADARASLQVMIERTTVPFLARALGIAVAVRNTNFDADDYREKIVTPYRSLEKLSRLVDRERRDATDQERREGAELLIGILRAKGSTPAEIQSRLDTLSADSRTEPLSVDDLLAHV